MTIRIINEELSQEIYEALLKRSSRSFDRYNRLRALPRLKIPGELAFFLDDLLDFAADLGVEHELVGVEEEGDGL